MFGAIDSIGAIMAMIIAGLLGLLAVVGKLFSRERDKRKDAEHDNAVLADAVQRTRRVTEAANQATKTAAAAEEEVVAQAKTGRRDHFEGQ